MTAKSAPERETFIAAMRSVASSVAVVTTGGKAGQHGATVSSFCSVSAEPPTMLVCLHDASRIANCVKENGAFCINILPQEMEEVANRFAGRMDSLDEDRFDGVDVLKGDTDCPQITGGLAIQCGVETQHVSGSHRVLIGRVHHISGKIDRPLTYLDGAYRPWRY